MNYIAQNSQDIEFLKQKAFKTLKTICIAVTLIAMCVSLLLTSLNSFQSLISGAGMDTAGASILLFAGLYLTLGCLAFFNLKKMEGPIRVSIALGLGYLGYLFSIQTHVTSVVMLIINHVFLYMSTLVYETKPLFAFFAMMSFFSLIAFALIQLGVGLIYLFFGM